ncbi:hypothetical protein [Pseudohaliea sp.]|uniref:hypothetical protein n=1 Tax=Pseudohaliea sp. TaxID=2740289 RepID=UPI0032ED9357
MKASFPGWRPCLSALLIVLPRSAAMYPAYLLGNGLLVDLGLSQRRAYGCLALIVGWLLLAYLIQSATGAVLSPTALLLELLLVAPFLLFVSGFSPGVSARDALWMLRAINLACLLLSLASYLGQGFPAKLPYVDFSADYYWAAYGWGGARIVTVLGFTGLLLEAAARGPSLLRTVAWSLVPAANFILPSYNFGILIGLVALGFLARRRPLLLLGTVLLAAPAIYYALVVRLASVNNTLYAIYGVPPKVLAYGLVADIYRGEPLTLLTGTGLGQFLSRPQQWCTEAVRLKRDPVQLPGLFTSSFYVDYFGPVLSHFQEHPRMMVSTLNKPYAGLSNLLAETGLAALVLVALFVRRAWALCRRHPLALVFFAFYAGLVVVEPWLDDLWLGYALLLVTAYFSAEAPVEASSGATPP